MATGVYSVVVEGVTLFATGIDYEEFTQMCGGFQFHSGGAFQRPDDVILDDYYADQTKAKLGDTINLLNAKWHVSGIMEGGKLTHIVVPLKTLQERSTRFISASTIPRTRPRPSNTSPEFRHWRAIRSFPWRISRRCSM